MPDIDLVKTLPTTFTNINVSFDGVYYSGLDWGDLDNDGDLDFIYSGNIDGTSYDTKIGINQGNDLFAEFDPGLIDLGISSVDLGDYDNDGDLDILLCGDYVTGFSSKIYRNDGGWAFTDIGANMAGLTSGSCSWGDYDNDGDLDAIITGQNSGGHYSKVYRNDSNDVFTDAGLGLVGLFSGDSDWGDYDNDGDLDIIVSGSDPSYQSRTIVYRNDGAAGFVNINAGLTGVYMSAVQWVDFNSDGLLDIMLSGESGSNNLVSKLYKNLGGGSFTEVAAGFTGLRSSSFSWGDYNCDGWLDLAINGNDETGSTGHTYIYKNNGDETFTLQDFGITDLGAGDIEWGDYDNDNDLDLIVAGHNDFNAGLYIYRNDGGDFNNAPNPPSNLKVSHGTSSEVTLSWKSSTDAETLQGGLTYNIRIGTTPGGEEIMSSMAFQNDGMRKLVGRGNANHNVSWTIGNLTEGIYYWSVQTVDNNYAGSVFSIGPVFTIGHQSCPGLSTINYGGQDYNTSLIGNQCWLKENLNIGQRVNGEQEQTDNLILEKYCYDDNEASCDEYGGLYQWNEMMQYTTEEEVQGICPTGWHIPTDEEWKILEGTVDSQYGVGDPEWNGFGHNGFDAVKNLKSLDGWISGGNGTDFVGFTGLPSGRRKTTGSFSGKEYYGYFWTSTQHDAYYAWEHQLHFDDDDIYRSHPQKFQGFSVRCINDTLFQPSVTASFSAVPLVGEVPLTVYFSDTSSGSTTYWEWDFQNDGIVDSYEQNPIWTYNQAGTYSISLKVGDGSTYVSIIKESYVLVYDEMDWEPCPGTPYLEYGSKIYNTVKIGDLCWTRENLNIGLRIDDDQESADNEIIEKYCFDNDEAYCDEYGGLYQWNEMMQYTTEEEAQGICPTGWHIPSDEEWKILEGTVDSQYGVGNPEWDEISWRGFDAGHNLKSTEGWSNGGNGIDEFGFNALPGGWRYPNANGFSELGNKGYWWTSTIYEPDPSAGWYRTLSSGSDGSYRMFQDIEYGYSVRCVKDTIMYSPVVSSFSAMPLVGEVSLSVQFADNSTGSPISWQWDFQNDGIIDSYEQNPEWTYNEVGVYSVFLKVGDGNSFDSLLKEDYIVVHDQIEWDTCPGTPYIVYDSKIYNTILIGEQCWLKENLNIGTRINTSVDQADNGVIEKYCYNNSEDSCNIYGGLYQWDEMMQYVSDSGAQGICPEGWHIATHFEWQILANNVSAPNTGKKLQAPGNPCINIGCDDLGQSGFDALLGGLRYYNGSSLGIGEAGDFWTSSQSQSGYPYTYKEVHRDNPDVITEANYGSRGFSIRCLKDSEPQPWSCGDTLNYEGQNYSTVAIGDQCWMEENLNIGTRLDGAIEQKDNSIIEKYCYNDNEDSCAIYGGLYQWDEMMQYTTDSAVQGICPVGWHLPSTYEWHEMIQYLGGYDIAGGKLKEEGYDHWASPNTGATNESGFTALPGGFLFFDGNAFLGGTFNSNIWTSNFYGPDSARVHYLSFVNVESLWGFFDRSLGLSVRCVKDENINLGASFSANNLSGEVPLTVSFTDNSAGSPTSWQWDFQNDGIIDSYDQNPQWVYNEPGAYSVFLKISDGTFSDSLVKESYVTVSEQITWDTCPGIPTFEYGWQLYHTVLIGDQCWMRENLNIGQRIDGINDQLDNSLIEKYCYGDNESNCEIYGGLYQWDEMMQYTMDTATQGICPEGWHIPTNEEWKILEGNVDSQYGVGDPEWDDIGWRGNDAGEVLKSETGWISGGNGSNLYNFSGLPGGCRTIDQVFGYSGYGYFWTSSLDQDNDFYRRLLGFDKNTVGNSAVLKENGFSIRCLYDEPFSQYEIITSASPSEGGSTYGGGTYFNGIEVTVEAVENQGYTFIYWKEDEVVVTENRIYNFTVESDRHLIAHFEKLSYEITTSSEPVEGGLTSGDGIYSYNDEATVVANPSVDWSFYRWTEKTQTVSSEQEYSFIVTEDRDLVANFTQEQVYNVSINSIPEQGGITLGSGNYTEGETVTIKARPETGWNFIGWKENSVSISTDTVYTFEITSSRNFEAHFEKNMYSVSVYADPLSGGEVEGDSTYYYGDEATVKAIPNNGWTFVEWQVEGSAVSMEEEYSFTVAENIELKAIFIIESTLSLALESSTSEEICSGDTVVITGYPTGGAPPYTFEWSSLPAGVNGSDNSIEDAPGSSITYILNVTDEQENTLSDSLSIVVLPSPPANIVAKGSPPYVIICIDSGYYYQWYHENQMLEGETRQFYYPGSNGLSSGSYHVEVANVVGCTTKSNVFTPDLKEEIGVWPNPNSGRFNLVIPAGLLKEGSKCIVSIIDMTGNIVERVDYPKGITNEPVIKNLTINRKGIFMLQLTTDETQISKKIVVF